MQEDKAIIALLTEIRDAQREEFALRRKVTEESLNLQRQALRRQQWAAIVGALILVIGIGFVIIASMSRPHA